MKTYKGRYEDYAKDDLYYNTIDKVNMLIDKGYIEEDQKEIALKRLLEKARSINSNDRQERDGNP